MHPGQFVTQHVAPLFFGRTRPGSGKHLTFAREDLFWAECEKLPFKTVQLNGFRLSDWFPRAPGIFWSHHGRRAREYSGRYHERVEDPELGLIVNPHAKMSLIEEGGMGTIRLRPRCIENTDCWFGTGVVGPQCAGGIPLAIPDALMQENSLVWGSSVELSGQVRYLQDVGLDETAYAVRYARPLLVLVEELKVIKDRQPKESIVVSPVVLFDTGQDWRERVGHYDIYGGMRYTFVQCAADGDTTTDIAAAWLERYATKHGGRVITNFDEQRPIMADAPLSYQRLVRKTYDRTIIEHLHMNGGKLADHIDHITMEHAMSVSVTLGDGNVIQGDFVVANSIRDSFNRVAESNSNAKLKKLLVQLSSQVGTLIKHLDAERAEAIARDLETLTKEATSAKPRRKWWELSVQGLKDAATAVRDVGKPVLETLKLLLPVLNSASPGP